MFGTPLVENSRLYKCFRSGGALNLLTTANHYGMNEADKRTKGY